MAAHQSTQYAGESRESRMGSGSSVMPNWEQAQEMVSERPVATVALCFGLGVGAGLLMASLFSHRSSFRRESGFEQVGRNVLEAIQRVLPENISSWASGR